MTVGEWISLCDGDFDLTEPDEWLPYSIQALRYRKEPFVGTVLSGSVCHYCGDKATTEDHIVPRCDLPRPMSRVPYWFRSCNVVPSCAPCNNYKSNWRSDCMCDHCSWAWITAKACFLGQDYTERGIRNIVRSPG